jgi:hypothetical protein
MIKSSGRSGTASVTFTLDAAVGASHAVICGEWNNWSPDRDVMEPAEGGGFTRTVELEPGRTYRFRYLLDGHGWENDWAADSYLPNDHGGNDSVVDLTALPEDVPAVSTENAPKRAAATKAPPPKRATAKKAPAMKAAPGEVAPAEKAKPIKAGQKAQPAKKAAFPKKTAKKTTRKAGE